MLKSRHAQAGLSLVELLVGTTIGLFIVAAAALVLSSQLTDNRRLLLEAQVQQDLRAAADILTRELRRSGHWGNAQAGVWVPGAASAAANPYAQVSLPEGRNTGTEVTAAYFRPATGAETDNDSVDDRERAGFRLSNSAIQMLLGAGNWQPLTDPGILRITELSITLSTQSVPLSCHLSCVAADCPPSLNVRTINVQISGQAASDALVNRSLSTRVRLPNDTVSGSCP